jgi:hypothetical protein
VRQESDDGIRKEGKKGDCESKESKGRMYISTPIASISTSLHRSYKDSLVAATCIPFITDETALHITFSHKTSILIEHFQGNEISQARKHIQG